MKKRIVTLALAAVMLAGITSLCCSPAQAKKETLNVYNWGDYISDGSYGLEDVNAAFTDATGIEVNYSTYESNESLYTKLKTGGSSYDVIIPSDYMIARMINEGMLEKIDYSNIPNYVNVIDQFRTGEYDPSGEYTVPYLWGTVGIIYNTKYVDDVTGWSVLWDERYKDKILMFDNPRDAFAAAEFSLGIDINTESEADLRAAADFLKEQHPLVQAYVMDEVFGEMERAEAWVAPYYAGDFVTMHKENPDLAFCFPEEGFNLYVDAMCIPTSCQNKSAAEEYINFMCSFDAAYANAGYSRYGSPIKGVEDALEFTDYERSVAYPSSDILARGKTFLNLSAEANELMDSLWLEVRTNGNTTGWVPYAATAAVIVIAAAALLVMKANKKKKRAARRRANAQQDT